MPAPTTATSPTVQRILADPRSQQLRRELTVERKGIDEKARTVELAFASAEPVERFYGNEVLEISDSAIDFGRLRNGAALLLDHDWTRQIGVVVKAWVAGGKARALVKLSRSALGEEIWTDILDEVRSLISVGYIVKRMEPMTDQAGGDAGAADNGETFRVTAWEPFEISVVAVAADYLGAGIGRSKDPDARAGRSLNPQPQISVSTTPVTAANHAAEIIQSAAVLKQRHPSHRDAIDAAVLKFANDGGTADAFARHVAETILATRDARSPAQLRQSPDAAFLGLSQRDLSRYSLRRAILKAADNQPLDGLEREASDEVAKRVERAPKGFFVPDDFLFSHRTSAQRTLQAGNAPDGGYTIATEVLAQELVEVLRAESRVASLGARIIPGLVGDIAIPRHLTGASVYWVSETGSITQSSATFGQIAMRPRRIGASVPFTRQFLAQSSLSGESFVRDDILRSIAVELDRVAICGTGTSQPLGILNMASGDRSTSVSFSAAPTWPKYLEFFANVAGANALLGMPAYLTTAASAAKAMGIPKFSNTATPIWDNGKVGEFRAAWSNQFPSSPTANQVIFGDFSQVIYGEWSGKDVIVDPFTGKKEGIIEVTIQQLVDLVIRQGKSFAISSDSGAQ